MLEEKLIKWLKECYREDHTRAGFRDFFSASIENRQIVRSEDRLACGFLDDDVLTPAYFEKLTANLALHTREKEFLYGCLFFIGKIGQKRYRAPLIIYPAKVSKGKQASVSIEHALYRINYSLLDMLDNKELIEEGVMQAMRSQNGVLTLTVASEIAKTINLAMPEIDVDKIIEWPHLTGVTSSQADDQLRLLPSAGWCVVKRSQGSSGVIDELNKLGSSSLSEFSQALRDVLVRNSKYDAKSGRDRGGTYISPARLSENQEHLLRSARNHSLTICHGPPGTGKSFTIANMAIDHITRGDSVLVVSKKDHAVDVIYEIIAELLESNESMVRVGRKHYLREFKHRIARILSSRVEADIESDKDLSKRFESLLKQISYAEEDFLKTCETSLSRGPLVGYSILKWYQKPLKRWYEYRAQCRPLLLDYADIIEKKKLEKDTLVKELIARRTELRINEATTHFRNDIKGLLKGLRKRKSSDQLKAFDDIDFSVILKIFPIWLTSLNDLHRVLPLEKELFDVVILDESSQCDIASALPAIQRAKRVVIAGDSKQLRHVSFVSKDKMKKLANDFELNEETQITYDYRAVSLMDLAIENTQHGHQVATLNEHFRSVKPIISFSNDQFYNGKLRIMRERKWEQVCNSRVELHYCNGERSSTGVNQLEVDTVIEVLDQIIKEDLRSKHLVRSIGILSPFRSQVDAITKHVQKYARLSGYVHLLARHEVKVGTAHSFQGEERDVMLISLAIGESDNAGARRFLEQRDVFNVSITRAKEQQIIFHSLQPNDLPANSLLAKYLDSVKNTKSELVIEDQGAFDDQFVEKFTESCIQYGIKVSLYQSVASIPVDVLLEKDGKYLGVDLIGYPGRARDAIGIKKQQILDRVGIKIVPIGFVEWQVREKEIINKLTILLKES